MGTLNVAYLLGKEASEPSVNSSEKVRALRYRVIKRIMDALGGLFALVLFSPLIAVIALLIRLTSNGPVFFTQERVGQYGRLFKIYKFRTMYVYQMNGEVVHADQVLDHHSELLETYKKNSYKLQDDPRVTSIGKVLRRFSLDEIPQLLNVLKGDMSLVGPRAFQEGELVHQQQVHPETIPWVRMSLMGKPGASGSWQISGRSLINFDKRVKMDAEYVQRRSILYDLWILIKTPFAMIVGKGAF